MAYVARKAAGVAPTAFRWEHPALSADDITLRAAAHRAKELGQTNGWSPSTIRCTIDGLAAVLTDRLPGQRDHHQPDSIPDRADDVHTSGRRNSGRTRPAHRRHDTGDPALD